MAQAFRISPHHIGLNLDRSEEILLLLSMREIAAALPPQVVRDFEEGFFVEGRGVSERILFSINIELRRFGKRHLLLHPRATARTAYMALRSERRAAARIELRKELDRSPQSAEWLAEARTAEVALPTPEDWHAAEQEELFSELLTRLASTKEPLRETEPAQIPLSESEIRARTLSLARASEQLPKPTDDNEAPTNPQKEPTLGDVIGVLLRIEKQLHRLNDNLEGGAKSDWPRPKLISSDR